jgi:hypothetical protein
MQHAADPLLGYQPQLVDGTGGRPGTSTGSPKIKPLPAMQATWVWKAPMAEQKFAQLALLQPLPPTATGMVSRKMPAATHEQSAVLGFAETPAGP